MRHTGTWVLGLLLLGATVGPAGLKSRPAWWTSPAASLWSGGPTLAVLTVPTGPVGAMAVDPADALTIYLGGGEGFFRSTDGGDTWDLLSRELRYPHILLIDPAERSHLYAARRDEVSFLPMPAVYRSVDGGYTWKQLADGLGQERIFSLALDPLRHGVLYAGTWAGRIYGTTDEGEHWSLLPGRSLSPCPTRLPSAVSQLLVNPVDGALYAVETCGGLSRSTDGGVTWTRLGDDGGWLAVDAVRGDLYLAGRRLQRSSDGGRTWVDLSAGLPLSPATGSYATHWVAVNPEPLVLYTRYHRSTDGGTTWKGLETPPSFVPRLLLPGARPAIYGSLNGQAARYQEGVSAVP